jgi:hypothetical protein
MSARQDRVAANVRARLDDGDELVTTLNGTQWSWLWFMLLPIWALLRIVAVTADEVLVFRANPLSPVKPLGLLGRFPRADVRAAAAQQSVFLPDGRRIVIGRPDRDRLGLLQPATSSR